jgi:hypothetical protein
MTRELAAKCANEIGSAIDSLDTALNPVNIPQINIRLCEASSPQQFYIEIIGEKFTFPIFSVEDCNLLLLFIHALAGFAKPKSI